jgi:hypothetical protein
MTILANHGALLAQAVEHESGWAVLLHTPVIF